MRSEEKSKIAVVGAGYVGLSLAVLLSKKADVALLDIDESKLKKIASGRSPIKDQEIETALKISSRRPVVTCDPATAFAHSDFIIVATPTDYDPQQGFFDTTSVEHVIAQATKYAPSALVIIKSTVPVGFTERMRSRHATQSIVFSPEFLREGRALQDNLHPSRIVVGDKSEKAKSFAELLKDCSDRSEAEIILTGSSEAEAIKLFSNTFLAMRIAFFNELDTFALAHDLDTKPMIEGVCANPRIGNFYNNPSFGYGGYCLPKDTRQILSHYQDIPQSIIQAVVTSNETRKASIAKLVQSRAPNVVGIYRLGMKSGSDNFRASAVLGVMYRLRNIGVKVLVYEPAISTCSYENFEVERSFIAFKNKSDVILANRIDGHLKDISDKVISRDIFARD